MAHAGSQLLLVLLLWSASCRVRSEIFSSMASLRELADSELSLMGTVDEYLTREEARLTAIRSLLTERRAAHKYNRNPEIVKQSVDHPVTAYVLVRDWAAILNQMQGASRFEKVALIATSTNASFPSMSDHEGALRALIRLQDVYNVSAADMAAGEIWGHKANALLSSRDFLDLGTMSHSLGKHEIALAWLEKAKTSQPEDGHMYDIVFYLALSHYALAHYEEAIRSAKDALSLDLEDGRLNTAQLRTVVLNSERAVNASGGTKRQFTRKNPNLRDDLYRRLCSRELHVDPPEWSTPHVWCEYRSSLVPYAPYKVEILSQDPPIARVYEVLSDEETNTIKRVATGQLERARVGHPGRRSEIQGRICKTAWLYDDNEEKTIVRLSRRVEMVTGLSTTYRPTLSSADALQVANYGMGGQFATHFDSPLGTISQENERPYLRNTGKRLATFMFYLSDVTEGGATVFPSIKLYVQPVKNAGVLWYNFYRNGTADLRTSHAGCPVLIGEKWIATKWVREYGQEFRWPCLLTSNGT